MNPAAKINRQLVIYRRNRLSSYWSRDKTVEVSDALASEEIDALIAANLPNATSGEIVLAQWKHDGKLGAILLFRISTTAERITPEQSLSPAARGVKDG